MELKELPGVRRGFWHSRMAAKPEALLSVAPQRRELARKDGSVRARASKYSLCPRTDDDVLSRSFQDGQHGHGAAEELESAAIGGNVLVMTRVRAEEVAEFIVGLAEPSG